MIRIFLAVSLLCFTIHHLISMFFNYTEHDYDYDIRAYDLAKCHLKESSEYEIELLNELENLSLLNKRYTTSDSDHYYNFGICKKAQDSVNDDVGLIQINKEKGDKYIIGKLSNVEIEGNLKGNDKWIYITYRDGDKYHKICDKSPRQAKIMIMCNQNSNETFKIVKEYNQKDNERCAYIFELRTPLMCSIDQSKTTASTTTKTNISPYLSENNKNLQTNLAPNTIEQKSYSKIGIVVILIWISLI